MNHVGGGRAAEGEEGRPSRCAALRCAVPGAGAMQRAGEQASRPTADSRRQGSEAAMLHPAAKIEQHPPPPPQGSRRRRPGPGRACHGRACIPTLLPSVCGRRGADVVRRRRPPVPDASAGRRPCAARPAAASEQAQHQRTAPAQRPSVPAPQRPSAPAAPGLQRRRRPPSIRPPWPPQPSQASSPSSHASHASHVRPAQVACRLLLLTTSSPRPHARFWPCCPSPAPRFLRFCCSALPVAMSAE